jgi:ATP-binding cassette subfamily B protein
MSIAWGVLPGLDCFLGTIILFVLDYRLACLAAVVWPWCLLIPPRIAGRAASTESERKQREAEMLEVVQEQIATQTVIRAYGLARLRILNFFKTDARLFEARVRATFFTALTDQATWSGILLLQVLTLAAGAWLASRGKMTIGTPAAFQSLFLGVSTSLLYFTQYVRSLSPAQAGMQRIDEFLNAADATDERPNAHALAPFCREITLAGVTFSYGDTVVLQDVSLIIPCGSNVAIVGPSGSGKSTMLNLLLGFHDPTHGAVRVDGVDLKTVSQESWRSQFGVVFQENLLFRASVGDNIRMGRPDAQDSEVEEAAGQAGIDKAIRRLPQGFHTHTGELGTRLSGGERQRIALARALVRQPRVLVLDEATSALDPQTAGEISITLRKAALGRTVISVTHHLASITHCDHIFVMNRGRLAEHGTHEQLVAAGGIYSRLWRSIEDGRRLDSAIQTV